MQIHFLWSRQSICLSEQRNITLQLSDTTKTAKTFPRSQTRSPGFVLPQLASLRTTRYS